MAHPVLPLCYSSVTPLLLLLPRVTPLLPVLLPCYSPVTHTLLPCDTAAVTVMTSAGLW